MNPYNVFQLNAYYLPAALASNMKTCKSNT